MEEGQIGEEAELGREVSGNVAVVEVNAGNHSEGSIGRRWSTEDSIVGADIWPYPVFGEVEGIREDGQLPCLEGNVGLLETWVLKVELLEIILDSV